MSEIKRMVIVSDSRCKAWFIPGEDSWAISAEEAYLHFEPRQLKILKEWINKLETYWSSRR